MADPSKPPKAPISLPPELPAELETSWDDDTAPSLDLDEPMSESAFDRVTAVPDLPAEQFAKQVMAQNAGRDSKPEIEGLGLPPLASEPPMISVVPGGAIDVRQEPPRASRPTAPAPPGARGDLDPLLELDLGDVARSAPPPALLVPSTNSPRDASITEMKDRYAMGDFSGALVVAEGLIEADAADIDAQRYAQSCRDVLTQMYSSRLGALSQRVRVAVPGDQIRWLSLDHRAGFMLSLVDGSCTVEELLDISGMNRLDALRILFTLYDQRVIALS